MAPKAAAGVEGELEDEVLQAIILADSFNKRFMPLTLEKPRVRLHGRATTAAGLTLRDW
jgi:translation initiation factor eIF-2B subunit epsilon